MKSKITYARGGVKKTAYIKSRLEPSPLAVKYVVIAKEMQDDAEIDAMLREDLHLDPIIEAMGIVIVSVKPTADSDPPKPYSRYPLSSRTD